MLYTTYEHLGVQILDTITVVHFSSIIDVVNTKCID